MNINSIDRFFKDVENDVKTFETSMDKGDMGAVNMLMPIIKEEMEQLARMAQEKGTPIEQERVVFLSSKWDSLASRVSGVVQPTDFVGKERPLQDLVDMYHSKSSTPAKRGLQTIMPLFHYIRIRGDGHCLFRAIAFVLADQLCQQSFEEREQFFIGLAERVADLTAHTDRFSKEPRSLALLHKEFMDIFMKIASDTCSICDVLNHPVDSQKVVAFLRVLACAQNTVHAGETYEQQAADYSGSLAAYELAMTDMSMCELGSEGEVRALAEALGINLQVLDVQSVGTGGDIYPEHLRFSTSPSPQTGFLLYRPGHYDVAIEQHAKGPPKIAQGVEAPSKKRKPDVALAHESNKKQKQEEADAKLARMLAEEDAAHLAESKRKQEAADARLAQKLAREQE